MPPSRMHIPFIDLARQFRSIEQELVKAFLDVGHSGVYIMGEKLESPYTKGGIGKFVGCLKKLDTRSTSSRELNTRG